MLIVVCWFFYSHSLLIHAVAVVILVTNLWVRTTYGTLGFTNALCVLSFIWYFQHMKMEFCLQTNNIVGWKILEVLYQPKAWRSYLKIQMSALTVRSRFRTATGLYENIYATALVWCLCAKILAWNVVMKIMWHWNTKTGTHAWMHVCNWITDAKHLFLAVMFWYLVIASLFRKIKRQCE